MSRPAPLTPRSRSAVSRVAPPVILVVAIVATLVAAAACVPAASSAGSSDGSTDGAASGDLTVFGAASLTDALAELRHAYEAAHPGLTVVISTDSSAALATQIEQGAPADVFLSADTENAERLVHDGFAAGDAVVFAGNELAIIVPAGNPAGLATAADLARPGLRIVAAGDRVPITRYATELVANLALEPGYPSDFARAYESNVVSREDNVKAVVAKIELGEGDAGIVYRTDAEASSKTGTVVVPADANVAASYAGVVVKGTAREAAATAFLDWLTGPDGQAILAAFGFAPPS